jgi:hypothetical protein|tara:strand:- start:621 stop:767 length:147 start_codon:yes stop_codon:yes gene_type:complete
MKYLEKVSNETIIIVWIACLTIGPAPDRRSDFAMRNIQNAEAKQGKWR